MKVSRPTRFHLFSSSDGTLVVEEVDPEVDREGVGLEALLEHVHRPHCVAIPLLKVTVLLPVTIAVGIALEELGKGLPRLHCVREVNINQ